MDFTNKTAVVTGAAQGIGAAVVRALAERGAHVAALDIDAGGLATMASELCGEGRRVTPFAPMSATAPMSSRPSTGSNGNWVRSTSW